MRELTVHLGDDYAAVRPLIEARFKPLPRREDYRVTCPLSGHTVMIAVEEYVGPGAEVPEVRDCARLGRDPACSRACLANW